MTLPEILLALDDGDQPHRPPAGSVPLAAHNREEYARWWRGLSPRQRLEVARDG